MGLYLTKFGYTAEAWQRMLANPEDRREMLASMVEAAGGKLLGFWYAFGDCDGYSLIEAVDEVAAASVLLKAASGGAFTTFSTTKLISVDDTLQACRRASELQYRPPGAPG